MLVITGACCVVDDETNSRTLPSVSFHLAQDAVGTDGSDTVPVVTDASGADLDLAATLAATRGSGIVRANLVGTAVFAITAVVSAVVFESPFVAIAAAVALALFFVGIAAFLWSFWTAVQRSRGEQVAVTQLYFLTSGVAPRQVRVAMLLALLAQCAVGLGTALGRPNADDGSPGTALALGVLVPLFGFGLNGLWAALHGRYSERPVEAKRTTAAPIDQNEDHG